MRDVIICLDGVGVSVVEELRAEGHFRAFGRPSQMISTFPSLTNLAMSAILKPAGAKMAAGYEDNYFDVSENRMRGSLLDRLRGGRFIRGTFRELFDYHPTAVKSGLGYAAPPLSTYLESLSDLVRLRQKASAASRKVFFAYTGASDSLAHLGGEWMVRGLLKRLDAIVEKIVRDGERAVNVTLFSDHGNHFGKYKRAGLKSPLRLAGFRLEEKISDGASVVFPQFGLVGSAVLFTQDENKARAARAVAKVEGVDFAAYERAGVVHVLSENDEATIERRRSLYRYRTIKGDPLGLKNVVRNLEANGKVDSEGFVADAEWFGATRDGARPDALRRIMEGVTDSVLSRASVVVNLRDGYYTGSSLLDALTTLKATHGNIGPGQSCGFVMSTDCEHPSHVRARDVWETLGSPRLRNVSG